VAAFTSINLGCGSPPHVRGTRIGTVNARSDVRITPARAGSPTGGTTIPLNQVGSPPRVRGEHNQFFANGGTQYGTHPPACEEHDDGLHMIGQSIGLPPRMCGECNGVFHQYAIVFGLSPHVRGTANVVVVGDDAVRITPVCTGPLFPAGRAGRIQRRITPAGTGEHDTGHIWLNLGIGTPPRVRGAQLLLEHVSAGVRIARACAGAPALRSPYDDLVIEMDA
jgi:hypothetical protein